MIYEAQFGPFCDGQVNADSACQNSSQHEAAKEAYRAKEVVLDRVTVDSYLLLGVQAVLVTVSGRSVWS